MPKSNIGIRRRNRRCTSESQSMTEIARICQRIHDYQTPKGTESICKDTFPLRVALGFSFFCWFFLLKWHSKVLRVLIKSWKHIKMKSPIHGWPQTEFTTIFVGGRLPEEIVKVARERLQNREASGVCVCYCPVTACVLQTGHVGSRLKRENSLGGLLNRDLETGEWFIHYF